MAKKGGGGGNTSGKNGIEDLLSGVINLNKQMPEINRYAIYLIAKRAVVIAKQNVEGGGNPGVPHSEWTEELTEKLRGGSTAWELYETGHLKDSIRVMSNTVAMGRVYVEIGSDVVYAAILEYGGHPGGAVGKPGTDQGYIPPRPYLRPAIQEAIWEALGSNLEGQICKAYELCVQQKPWKSAFTGI